MKLIFAFLIIPFCICCSSCNQGKSTESNSENWDKKNTRVIESYDEVNKLPIKMAQDSLNTFLELFNKNKNINFSFSIKSKFTDEENIENMWSIVDSIKNDTLFTTLDNVPLKLTNIKLNDNIKVAKENIEDWIIYKSDSITLGNFMQRYRK